MREQRFGIEIELAGITREKAAKVTANFFGTQSGRVGRGYDAYHVPDGEGRTWKVMNDSSLLAQNKERPSSRRAFECIWYGTKRPECCHRHYNGTRYHALNLHATWTKGTIEFRCFNSTTHAGEVKSYVQLCLAVSSRALAQSRASFKPTNTDNDKYAMRCWLLKMGLIGDEFKTCRHHLTKHLEGNSAWRYAA